METYPYGVFRTLAGGRIPPKRSAAGRRERLGLLLAAGLGDPAGALVEQDHDLLDAAAAALVALRRLEDRADLVTCGHDDSAIWLPAGE